MIGGTELSSDHQLEQHGLVTTTSFLHHIWVFRQEGNISRGNDMLGDMSYMMKLELHHSYGRCAHVFQCQPAWKSLPRIEDHWKACRSIKALTDFGWFILGRDQYGQTFRWRRSTFFWTLIKNIFPGPFESSDVVFILAFTFVNMPLLHMNISVITSEKQSHVPHGCTVSSIFFSAYACHWVSLKLSRPLFRSLTLNFEQSNCSDLHSVHSRHSIKELRSTNKDWTNNGVKIS